MKRIGYIDGRRLSFLDDYLLTFGTGKDVTIGWDGAKLEILPLTNDVGAINFGDGSKDIDVKIFLGSVDEYVLFDVGNSRVVFGASGTGIDVVFEADEQYSYVLWDQDGDGGYGCWYFGRENAYGMDVKFMSQTGGDFILWDASAKQLQFVDVELCFDAAAQIQWATPAGGTKQFWMYYDGSSLNILAAADKVMQIGDDTNTIALKVYGFIGLFRTDTVGATEGYVWYDTASNKIHFAGPGAVEQEVTSGAA